ncbi:hypothetical protein BCT46_18320 [Vibrio sp. 10N.261.46.E8]|nr:hypothetical protein BH584_10645 [Vibrio sp. 10N.261.45.E1]PMJ36245.1 hypothetical protein BCU27_23325 [Vibrio sp. 10N.286.45.B6]PML96134.1 hypothetical protein BCT66_22280 [Vibrio sp. 10N.261.49.E11]PMM68421.1 hypothetical protein BCT48_11690 [Vibrio sp. 10N.261.46.F12]PMM80279.1 hypothetical protein BCT46_18320 [Vibrio sp. 10N.261.46.E8]PMN32804.1 hypothetical protein BCT34_13490 [Vibrio sp. 10N.261.45.E2]PMN86779.1 hypothetical protein BCT25_01645 [Vibrio sp. 10N.261.45.A6]
MLYGNLYDSSDKLILWNSTHDLAIAPQTTINYYNEVIERDPTAKEDVTIFMLPGVNHCAGGEGPWLTDWFGAANQWSETGVAPTELPAAYVTEKGIDGSGKLCAYPTVAHWDGKGDQHNAASFSCVTPE